MNHLNPKPVPPLRMSDSRRRAGSVTRTRIHPAVAVAGFALALSACEETLESSCFAAGTLVATPYGPRRIEFLRVGDEVLSYSLVSRALVTRRIRATLRGLSRVVAEVWRAGRLLAVASPAHPFFAAAADAFTAVAELGDGSTFLGLRSDGSVTPRGHRVLPIDGASRPHPVYNLSVDGEENYFAGSLLVHNKSYTCEYTGACGRGGGEYGLAPELGSGGVIEGLIEEGGALPPVRDAAATGSPAVDAARPDADAAPANSLSPDAAIGDASPSDASPLDAS